MADPNDSQNLDSTVEDYEDLLHEDSEVDDADVVEFLQVTFEEKHLAENRGEPFFENDGAPVELLEILEETGVEIPITENLSPATVTPSTSGTDYNFLHPYFYPQCEVVVNVEELHDSSSGPSSAIFEDHSKEAVAGVSHPADEHKLVEQPKVEKGHSLHQGQDKPDLKNQWKKGDILKEVYINDEDVPEELEKILSRAETTKHAPRMRATARKAKMSDNECMDVDVGQDDVLFAREEHSSPFDWSTMHDYQNEREKFLPKTTGPVVASRKAYEAFRQYWNDGILLHIVIETNRYAAGLAASSASFAKDWYDTNVHEILILFSFWMMFGIIRMPSTKSCFTKNPLLQTNIFRKMFSRSRYESLCRALHFNNINDRPKDDTNLLYCFGPILDHLNSRFQNAYVPSQNICIDESLTLWKSNLSYRQYVKTKTARFEVKTFELCESSTGYLWSFLLLPPNLVNSTSTVLKLLHPLLDKGYTLFISNWFNSPLLARYLKLRKTDCVGTLRPNCRDVPPLIAHCHLEEGQFVARHSGDVTVLTFQDRRRKVTAISTYHGTLQSLMQAKAHRLSQFKPQLIIDYNKNMSGVDREDQMLEPYLLERKTCAKWIIKVFKRLLNCSILNSRIILQASTSTSKEQTVFRLELVEQILEKHLKYVPRPTVVSYVSSTKVTSNSHWPKQIASSQPGRTPRRRCAWCSKHNRTQRRTTHVCAKCHVPLCIDPCFGLYHENP